MTRRRRLIESAADAVERVSRLAEVVTAPGGVRAMRSTRPFSIAAFRLVHGLADDGISYGTVVDIGANIGQFSAAALSKWPDAAVVAFEPLAAVAARLRETLAGSPNAEIHVAAVGSEDGAVTFHPHPYSLSSSVLPATAAAKRRHRWAEEDPPVEVPLVRLDTVLADRRLARPAVLKVDVQGYEREVLNGATKFLGDVDALVVELSFERCYEGQALFTETHDLLESMGWRLDRPLDWRRQAGRVVEMDCLYRPEGGRQATA